MALLKSGIGQLQEARKVIIRTGATGEIAEIIVALCRAYDRAKAGYGPEPRKRLTPDERLSHNRDNERRWREAHRDEMLALGRAYRVAHLFELRERDRETKRFMRADPEGQAKIQATRRRYYERHRESIIAKAAQSAAQDRSKTLAYHRAYYAAHREEAIAYAREHRKRPN